MLRRGIEDYAHAYRKYTGKNLRREAKEFGFRLLSTSLADGSSSFRLTVMWSE